MLDLGMHHPGMVPVETVTGGWAPFIRATGRMRGILELGPYYDKAEAEEVEAMLSELDDGTNWVLIPLHRSTWTGGDLYVTAAPAGDKGGTALTLNGMRTDMRVGQMFTVGVPTDPDTQHPRRVRRITGITISGGNATIQQWPPLPQAALGTTDMAARISPATHIPARITTPGSIELPRSAGSAGGYGPWVFEWVEYIFTGGG